MRRAAALIAGGGPAGAAAAITLARAGQRPLLLERTREPHDVVCGGFLGWDALAALHELGIDAAALGAHPIERVRIAAAGRTVEARLPRRAAGLARHRLDAELLQHAAQHGAAIERGVAVRAVGPEGLRTAGATIPGEAIILATGKHNLRGAARPTEGSVGLRLALAPSPSLARALGGVIELHLYRGGYAGLLLQEDGSANLCLSIDAARLAEAGDPARLIAGLAAEAPLLGERIAASNGEGRWSSIAAVPYGWRATPAGPALYRVGDQAAVIASLAGDGVAIALASGAAAARAILAGVPGDRFQRRFTARARRPVVVAERFRHIAERPALARPLLALIGHAPQALALAARATRIGH